MQCPTRRGTESKYLAAAFGAFSRFNQWEAFYEKRWKIFAKRTGNQLG